MRSRGLELMVLQPGDPLHPKAHSPALSRLNMGYMWGSNYDIGEFHIPSTYGGLYALGSARERAVFTSHCRPSRGPSQCLFTNCTGPAHSCEKLWVKPKPQTLNHGAKLS